MAKNELWWKLLGYSEVRLKFKIKCLGFFKTNKQKSVCLYGRAYFLVLLYSLKYNASPISEWVFRVEQTQKNDKCSLFATEIHIIWFPLFKFLEKKLQR